ncbi:MAG: FHIPEP family type III secretion protein, partial [Muribaculaceae bacterium]|nr:FHIPEP family type III secretion protein [Muribaculaceae bacterium]
MTDKSQYIFGIRAVIEAIEAGKQVDKILVKKDLTGELVKELRSVAQTYSVPLQRVPVERINRITRANHQGVLAMMAAVTYYKVEDMVPMLYDDGVNPFVVLLDGITDVRNFGAIARTCECAGVNALVIPERNSVTVNADAVKTSAGALNYLPVCREPNLVSAVKYLRDDHDAAWCLKRFGILTIGDGLVSQIPALLISITSGVIVTRVGSEN